MRTPQPTAVEQDAGAWDGVTPGWLWDLRAGVARPDPGYKLIRRRHGGKPPLPHQGPILELLGLLDFRKSSGWIETGGEFQIDYGGLGVLRIVARLGFDGCEPDDGRDATR